MDKKESQVSLVQKETKEKEGSMFRDSQDFQVLKEKKENQVLKAFKVFLVKKVNQK